MRLIQEQIDTLRDQTAGIEPLLSDEAREELRKLAHQSTLLQLQMVEIVEAEAARLAHTSDEYRNFTEGFSAYFVYLTLAEGARLAPETLPVNQHSM